MFADLMIAYKEENVKDSLTGWLLYFIKDFTELSDINQETKANCIWTYKQQS